MVELVPDWIYLRSGQPPERAALALPTSRGHVSFGELTERVARLAGGLSAIGVGRGERIAVIARDSVVMVELLLAASRIGAILAPIDERADQADLSLIAADIAPAVLLYERSFARAALTVAGATCCRLVAIDGHEWGTSPYQRLFLAAPIPPTPVRSDSPWITFYSRGRSAARRKVVLTHGDVLTAAIYASLPAPSTGIPEAPTITPSLNKAGLDLRILAQLLTGTETEQNPI